MKEGKILSTERINTGRQVELDLAKAVTLFMLPFIHTTILSVSEEELDHGLAYFFDSIAGGPFAAPMFVLAMGIGVIYSRKTEPKQFLIKGIGIYISGIFVNLFAEVIPRIIAFVSRGDPYYIEVLPYRFFGDNVFQFSGIAMILFSLLLYLKASDTVLVIIAVVLSAFSNLFYETNLGSTAANIIGGYFVGTQDDTGYVISDFPFCNWFIIFVAGYIFAKYLIRVKDKSAFYKRIMAVTLPLSVIYLAYAIPNRIGMFGPGQNCYYHARSYEIIMMIIFNLAMLSIYYFASLVLPQKVKDIAYFFSMNILQYYSIHLVLVSVACIIVGYSILGLDGYTMPQILIISFVISILSVLLADSYNRKIKPLIRRENEKAQYR